MQLDLQRCITDFPYYAKSLLKIKDINAELVPLNLNPPQARLHIVMDNMIQNRRLQRVIVLKARREGISTYAEARIFHCSHLNENTDGVIIAHEKDSGAKIFEMCRLYYECLPIELRPMTRYSSKKELVFENPDKVERIQNPGMRSSIEVLTAGKKNVARGAGYHNLHCSELSSWTFAEDVIPSLIPTIPKTERSIIVFESTAKGVGNFFHEEWLRAIEGESNFHAFFLPWFELPEYTREFNLHKEKDLFSQTLNDEEKELLRVHKLTLEQLYWRRWTIADLRGDVELFRQEYPATPEEAFIVSGSPIFNRQALREMAIKCTEPFFRGCLTTRGLAADEHGEFKVWQMPEKKGIYCLGVDVADGGSGGDYSCIEVFRKLSAPYFAEQVAEWHGRVDPYNFAHIIERIGKLFNSALVSIEVNAHGLATQQELQRDYWNLYQQTYLDRYDQKLTTKVGWDTTVRTKPLLVAFGSHCIADKTIIIHSGELIREGMTFIRDSGGGASAAGNGYDDRIMAALISLYTMHQAIGEEPPYEKTGVVRDPMAPAPMYIDPEFAWLLNYGHQNDYEDTWLNY